MSIISDISAAIGEVKKNFNAISQASDKIMKSDGSNGESRFFARPMDSVARAAKKSVLYFPVVMSESIGADTAATIAKAIQVRAAEYVRLMISNMGTINAARTGKQAVVAAIRGATLKDALMKEEFIQANPFVRKNLAELVEHTFLEDGLRDPLEKMLVVEASPMPPTPSRPMNTKALTPDAAADLAANMYQKARGGYGPDRDEVERIVTGILRNPYIANAREMLISKGLGDVVADLEYRAFKKSDHAERYRNTDAVQASSAVDHAKELFDNGTQEGRARAKAIVGELIGRHGHDVVEMIRTAGMGALIAELDLAYDEQEAARLRRKELDDPAAVEAQRRREEVAEAIRQANRMTTGKDPRSSPQGMAAATKIIQDIMATGDPTGIGALRNNKATARIVNMLEKLPDGVVRDGAYDISATSNKVTVAGNIDFNKLNQFQPVLLNLEIRYESNEGEPMPITDTLMLGVKGVAHPIPSLDIVTGLGTALQRDSLVLQFFRMTSGETSFLKDFVLNLNVAKSRSSARTTSGTKMLETLRRQSEWNDRRGNWLVAAITKRNFIPPTTTMVITADEVDKIRSLYGVDFSKPAVVRELLRSHNLMGFMIVDEAIGLVRVFEDGDDDFDRLPIDTLKAQGKETSVKDIMTILARS